MTSKLYHGDKVLVVNTMLYNGRIGHLAPTSGLEDDPWDFSVELLAAEGEGKLNEARKIGVHDFQVVPVNLKHYNGVELTTLFEKLDDQTLRLLLAEQIELLWETRLTGESFVTTKLDIQAVLGELSARDSSFTQLHNAWRALGGGSGTFRNYVETVAAVNSVLATA